MRHSHNVSLLVTLFSLLSLTLLNESRARAPSFPILVLFSVRSKGWPQFSAKPSKAHRHVNNKQQQLYTHKHTLKTITSYSHNRDAKTTKPKAYRNTCVFTHCHKHTKEQSEKVPVSISTAVLSFFLYLYYEFIHCSNTTAALCTPSLRGVLPFFFFFFFFYPPGFDPRHASPQLFSEQ